MEEQKADIKCPKCKTYKYPKDFLNEKNRTLKTCKECRNRDKKYRDNQKCEHGIDKRKCKQCGGSSICEHNRIRSRCKECGGASICEHNRIRNICKECGGSQICEHNKIRSRCKECGGSQICEHGRERNTCKECGGSQICEHEKLQNSCKICTDPIKITLKNWISSSRQKDRKYNIYDANNFVDKCFLKGLMEDYPNCYYCNIHLQYVEYQDDLATIERIDNSIGHIKSNCVIACRKCNLSRVGQRKQN